MHATTKIHKIFYWTIIFSMILSMSFPAGLVQAQAPEKIKKLLALKKLKSKQAKIDLPFNLPDAKLEKNKFDEGLSFEAGLGQAVVNEEIKTGRLATRPFKLKNQADNITGPEINTDSPLVANQAYFENLVKELNPQKPQSLTEAKSLGWPELKFEEPKSIKDLVKQVPKELADKIEFPNEEIIKEQSLALRLQRKSRTTPLLGLQPEYLIFFARQGGANPLDQTLKISNRGEGTINYTLNEASSWLSLDSSSGSVSTETDVINVLINTSGLTAASSPYVGEININNQTTPEDSRIVKARLIISATENFNSSFSYDANGNLRRRVDSEGQVVEYGYDNLNKLTRVIYPDASETSFEYDENGNRTSMTDQTGTTTYTYDQFDKLIAVQQPNINPTIYEYDKADRITKIVYPDMQEVSYTYDTDDRLLTVTDQTGTTTYTYNPTTGNLDSVALPNGVTTAYTYDTDGRLTDVVNRDPSSGLISGFHYTLDANGMRTQVVEEKTSGNKTTGYIYDELNRLRTVTYPDGRTVTYTYDELGNRLTMVDSVEGTTTYTYDDDNRLTKLNGPEGEEIFLYDKSGNLIKRAGEDKNIEYAYDFENKLISYDDGTNSVSFEYDGAGNRVAKTLNGERTNYINDLNTIFTQALIETDASWNVKKSYSYGLDRLSQRSGTGTDSFYHYNSPAKSVMGLTDSSGSVVKEYEYNVFGEILSESGSIDNVFGYDGEALDQETGLIFLRARYYDPSIGRFVSRDSELGMTVNPLSFNPYTFVFNNPVNFVDPSGLLSVIVWDFLGSFVRWGHTAIELDDGTYISFWPQHGEKGLILPSPARQFTYEKDIKAEGLDDEQPRNPSTVIEVPDLDEDAIKEWWTEYMNSDPMFHALFNNCADVVQQALDAGGLDLTAWFERVYVWTPGEIKMRLNDYDDITKEFTEQKNKQMEDADPGGVALDITAELMINIDDIAGATYDEKTGQLVLFGEEDVSLPEMDLDDLAVGVKSVFSDNDPGVSIDPPIVGGEFSVRYDGETEWTEFGWVMFEADRVLKILGLGKDNITGEPVTSSVPGWQSLLDRYLADSGCDGEDKNVRFWFRPKEVRLIKSEDGQSMVFDEVAMEVLTETTYEGGVEEDPIAQAFVDHFTEHYNEFAAEWPILKDLERLGKITAVVKWIKDSDIPLDVSFLENFEIEFYSTPETTPATTVIGEGSSCQLTLEGGVTYRVPNEYLDDDPVAPVTDEMREAALSSRPEETEFSWLFTAPTGAKQGEELTAVAHSFTRSRKDGNTTLTQTDLTIPVQGDFSLDLTRYYNSFNEKAQGFGLGWSVLPYQMRFPAYKRIFTFEPDQRQIILYEKIWLRENQTGNEDLYSLVGVDENDLPLYAKEGSGELLRENSDGTFSLSKKSHSTIIFNPDGTPQSVTDTNGNQLNYNYTDGKLTSISHPAGRQITLTYNPQNQITQIAGLDKTTTYTYEADGDLSTATYHPSEQSITYSYDSDHHLIQAIDNKGNIIFDYTYDVYGRALDQTFRQVASYSHDFDLDEQKTIITDPQGEVTENYFDESYRLTNSLDPLGNEVTIDYLGDYGPGSITDNYGQITDYEYDVHGNLKAVINDQNERMDFYYDAQDNLIGISDFAGQDSAFVYDENGNLKDVLHYALITESPEGLSISYDPDYVTNLQYDATGNLELVTDSEGISRDFDYEENGLPTVFGINNGPDVIFDYDTGSRLDAISQGQMEVGFVYDEADNIETINTAAGSISYDYDQNNNLSDITDAKLNQTHYDYDNKNNLLEVRDADNKLTSYSYDILNNLTAVDLPNGRDLSYQYDELGRLVGVSRSITTTPPDIAVFPKSLGFGTLAVGDSAETSFSVYNLGLEDLLVSSISSDNPSFSVDFTSSVAIPPQESFSWSVAFSPQAVSTINGHLTIQSSDPDQGTTVVSLTGTGKNIISGLTATAGETGINLNWNSYLDVESNFDHYNIYRQTEYFESVSSLTPLDSSITDIGTTTFADQEPEVGAVYYYAVSAVLTSSFEDSDVIPAGPVSFYSSFGALGDTFPAASSFTNEYKPSLAYNSTNNEYLAVYEYDYYGDGSDFDLYGQRISADGERIGSPFMIFASDFHDRQPQVAYNPNTNHYVVVFQYNENDIFNLIVAQTISATGGLIGGAFYVGGFGTSPDEGMPTIAYNSSWGEFLVAFESNYYLADRNNLIYRRINETGAIGGGYPIWVPSVNNIQPHLVYNLDKNTYVLSWSFDNSGIGTDYNLNFLELTASGGTTPNSGSFYFPGKNDYHPQFVYNSANNEYLLVWEYDFSGAGTDYDAMFVRYNSSSLSAPIMYDCASCYTNHNERRPFALYNSLGNEYLIAYEYEFSRSPVPDYDIRANRFSPTGQAKGLLTEISTFTNKQELKPALAYNQSNGEIMAAYEYDIYGDEANYDVYGRLLGPFTPALYISPGSLSFGDTTPQLPLYLSNQGEGQLSWYATSDRSWLWLSPYSGVISDSQTVYAFINRTGLVAGDYYGHLYFYSDGGNKVISVYMSVSNNPPDEPTDPSPTDGATDQSGLSEPLRIALNWEASDPDSGDTLNYDLYFSDNQSLVSNQDPTVLEAQDLGESTYTTTKLSYSTWYYWRIAARDQHGAETLGPVWSFETLDIGVPGLVAYLPDPTNNPRPTLEWSVVLDASNYHLQISEQSDFVSPIIDEDSLGQTSYTPTSDLLEGSIYWRVSSIDSLGQEGAFSEADDFIIDLAPPATPSLISYEPDPTDNPRPVLSWQEATEAQRYHLQIDESSDFAEPLVDQLIEEITFTPTSDLPEGTIYWRVSSLDLAGNESAFSLADDFQILFCHDQDGDGYGSSGIQFCTYSEEDCDDQDSEEYPEVLWYLDGDGDEYFSAQSTCQRGEGDPVLWYADSHDLGEDCDDTEATINPGATEVECDGIDQACDGLGDEIDIDDDSFMVCAGDCDDSRAEVNPGQLEIPYDELDNDCNPTTLDDDLDQDSYLLADDCDDTDPSIYPSASDPCDGIDQACDGLGEEVDADGDGYMSCEGDCNDDIVTIHPGALEVCQDEIDQDCNGEDLLLCKCPLPQESQTMSLDVEYLCPDDSLPQVFKPGELKLRKSQKLYKLIGSYEPLPTQEVDIEGDLAGYWALDEEEGVTAIDSSDFENPGIITDATYVTGAAGTALEFDGLSGHVQVSDDSAVQNIFDNGGSISFWMRLDSTGQGGNARIFDKMGMAAYCLSEESGYTKLKFFQNFSGEDYWAETVDRIIPLDGRWAFVTILYDSTSIHNRAMIFINGQKVNVSHTAPTGTRESDTGNDLFIGNRVEGDKTFDGIIDEFRIYNELLTGGEIQALLYFPVQSLASAKDSFRFSTAGLKTQFEKLKKESIETRFQEKNLPVIKRLQSLVLSFWEQVWG